MTTIVYRAGILAADSRAYSGDKTPIGTKAKIHSLEDGTIYGVSTNNVGGDRIIGDWVKGGCKEPGDVKPDSFSMLLIDPLGQVFFANDNMSLSGPLTGEYFAIGTGREYALAAMFLGASAEDAVNVAKEFDVWSGGPVMTLEKLK